MAPSTWQWADNALRIMSTNRNLDLSKVMLLKSHTQILEQSIIMEDVQQHLWVSACHSLFYCQARLSLKGMLKTPGWHCQMHHPSFQSSLATGRCGCLEALHQQQLWRYPRAAGRCIMSAGDNTCQETHPESWSGFSRHLPCWAPRHFARLAECA